LALAGLVPAGGWRRRRPARELGGPRRPAGPGCWRGRRRVRWSGPPTGRCWPYSTATRTGGWCRCRPSRSPSATPSWPPRTPASTPAGALDSAASRGRPLVDLTSGRLREGGSTIAQQYVKNVVTGDRRSLHRKLVEAVDAAALERTASKDRILAAYLNQVYFGDGVYGIATAAQHYFSRPVGKLSLAQAAALAGTIASPERFRPTAGREALARRNLVLNRMAAVGFASPARVAGAKRQPLAPRRHHQIVRYPYFVDDVTRTLLGDHALDAALGPAGSAARRRAVYEGGLSSPPPCGPPTSAGPSRRSRPAGRRRPGWGAGQPRPGQRGGGGHGRRPRLRPLPGEPGHRPGRRRLPPGSSFKVFYLVAGPRAGHPDQHQLRHRLAGHGDGPGLPDRLHRPQRRAGRGRPPGPAQATAESVNTYFAQLMVGSARPTRSRWPGAWDHLAAARLLLAGASAPRT
jgi:hypothetical protein